VYVITYDEFAPYLIRYIFKGYFIVWCEKVHDPAQEPDPDPKLKIFSDPGGSGTLILKSSYISYLSLLLAWLTVRKKECKNMIW